MAGRNKIFQHSRTIFGLRCWGCCSCMSLPQKQKVFSWEERMLSGAGISCRLCSQEMMQVFGSTGHSFCLHCCNLLWPCAAGIRTQPEERPCTKMPSCSKCMRPPTKYAKCSHPYCIYREYVQFSINAQASYLATFFFTGFPWLQYAKTEGRPVM